MSRNGIGFQRAVQDRQGFGKDIRRFGRITDFDQGNIKFKFICQSLKTFQIINDEKWNALLAFEATMMKERGNVAKIHG